MSSHQPQPNERLANNKNPILSIRNLSVWFGNSAPILRALSFEVKRRQVTALIGPSNCGKSTLVRCINRLNDLTPHFRLTGEILFNGQDLYASQVDATEIRKQIGMVFGKPVPFHKSIYEKRRVWRADIRCEPVRAT